MKAGDIIETISLIIEAHEKKSKESFYMVPSENTLSEKAKIPFGLDAYNRYFFKEDSLWGQWAFHGGKMIGHIETDILHPILKRLTNARYVNSRPISGLNCMMIALSAYCDQGDLVAILPSELGGHASTPHVAKRLGLNVAYLPAGDNLDLCDEELRTFLERNNPKLVYLDQSNVLFPVNIRKLADMIRVHSPSTRLHLDSSHLNGLILGGVFPNPLEEGADSFGGSTHKSFPGPHKGFFVTNDEEISDRFEHFASHLVSHHHMSDVISLAISLIEFEQKGGKEYACQMVNNAKKFAVVMDAYGFDVLGKPLGFTQSHQVWIDPNAHMPAYEASEKLYNAGLIVNTFEKLPLSAGPAFRIGLNEPTKYGLREKEIERLAEFFYRVIIKKENPMSVKADVVRLKQEFSNPQYCFSG